LSEVILMPVRCLPSDEAIAYSPVTRLSRWIEGRQITSQRLTKIYLERLEKFNPKLRCVITLTRERALAHARQADAEIAAGPLSRPAARHSLGR
jgi:Asp-tRNA(Asn)/Glu-tRNA(Gln) amidotransferase A subunit family amidase